MFSTSCLISVKSTYSDKGSKSISSMAAREADAALFSSLAHRKKPRIADRWKKGMLRC